MLNLPCHVDSSPIRYDPSSSAANGPRSDNIRSSSSNLFIRSSLGNASRNRRSDIHSDIIGSSAARRQRLFVDENGVAIGSGEHPSDAPTFSNLDPNTSDANALGGESGRFIWGTDVSLMDTMSAMKDFLLNFQKKYRLIHDGVIEKDTHLDSEHVGHQKEYMEMMKTMLDLGVTALNLDAKNLKAYPPTKKLWYQLQGFPSEIVPIMDLAIRDVMIDLAESRMKEMVAQRQLSHAQRAVSGPSSSAPQVPSSEMNSQEDRANGNGTALADVPNLVREVEGKTYRVRPFGLDKAVNLRDLNPGGM